MIHIASARIAVSGGHDAGSLRTLLTTGQSALPAALVIPRPPEIPANAWRRMSALSRSVMVTAGPLVDDARTALVWGSAIGEVGPTARFLERLFTRGPERASPLAFQTSVYNAPAGHLSIAHRLKGSSETVSAGGATGLFTLLRAVDLLRLGRVDRVVAVAAEACTPLVQKAYRGQPVAPGAVAAAVLLVRDGPGPTLEITAGLPPVNWEGQTVFTRLAAMPDEPDPLPPFNGHALESVLGLSASNGLVGIAVAAVGGGVVVDFDESSAISARVSP